MTLGHGRHGSERERGWGWREEDGVGGYGGVEVGEGVEERLSLLNGVNVGLLVVVKGLELVDEERDKGL